MIDHRLLICAVASVAFHAIAVRGLERLPPRVASALPPPIEVRVVVNQPPVAPPEEPPPPPPAPPVPPPPRPQIVHQAPTRTTAAPAGGEVAHDVPVPDRTPGPGATTDTPVFGVTMESTSPVGTGPALPVGNTSRPQPGTAPVSGPVRPLAAPVAAFQATKMPIPQGRCSGTYTEAARQAGIEGTVVLDLVVGEDGRCRDITVVEGLPEGLSEAAVTALRECHFTPGEKDGQRVAVKIRGFKIRFFLQGAP